MKSLTLTTLAMTAIAYGIIHGLGMIAHTLATLTR